MFILLILFYFLPENIEVRGNSCLTLKKISYMVCNERLVPHLQCHEKYGNQQKKKQG